MRIEITFKPCKLADLAVLTQTRAIPTVSFSLRNEGILIFLSFSTPQSEQKLQNKSYELKSTSISGLFLVFFPGQIVEIFERAPRLYLGLLNHAGYSHV